MLKESKPQSKSPTLSFHQHFKNLNRKSISQSPRYCSRSNPSRKSSREFRYTSSHCRYNSRSRFFDRQSPHNHSSF